MALNWETVPLLPLRCIMDHLSTEDALAAMSTCRHWRNAMMLYEGRRRTFEMRAKHNLEKNLFIARIFKRHTRSLHVYLDCNETELEKFMNLVLPQFFDSAKLQEVIFIGPSYIQQSHHVPFVKLNRVITESLVFKHLRNLQRLQFLGCRLNTLHNENEVYAHKQIEYYSRPLNISSVQTPADAVLSSGNQHLMQYSTLKHIAVDYEQINTTALMTLAHLPNFEYLSLNITHKKQPYQEIDWPELQLVFRKPLLVTVNIIGVPIRRFSEIMVKVLVSNITLISLKVMFCKSLYTPLLSHVSRVYEASLREVVWADSPHDSLDPYQRIVRPLRHPHPDTYAHVNPFVLLCWQCVHLQRLVIHGYWVWQYDLLGFVRLRKTLSHLEISAIYSKQDRYSHSIQMSEEGSVRVMCGDPPSDVDADFVQEVNEYIDFKWTPTPIAGLHPAIRGPCSAATRADFMLHEAKKPDWPRINM
ncbi:F-box only protein 33 [Trichoplusia ni]|uniref:F-box only protein 33 n=1 Tax=Trichoplusia ni TaxID=7111 RepID=A0A7E5VPL6_TRINI|nr:F-box only protein 33 [Trichoplusia ni]